MFSTAPPAFEKHVDVDKQVVKDNEETSDLQMSTVITYRCLNQSFYHATQVSDKLFHSYFNFCSFQKIYRYNGLQEELLVK